MRTLKAQVKELKKNKEHEGKGSKKQQEYLVQLEQKYREVCAKSGVPSNFGREGISILISVHLVIRSTTCFNIYSSKAYHFKPKFTDNKKDI